MKKILCCVLLAALLLTAGCAPRGELQQGGGYTDAMGYSVNIEKWDRVVSLYGSFAETWVLAGGELVGATSDAIEERGMQLGEDVAVVGTVKEPNLEEIIAAQPDLVLLSADIAAQVKMHDALSQAGITHAYYRVDTFEDYLAMLGEFCGMTGREDLYEKNGIAVKEQVDRVKAAVKDQQSPTVLLLRAFSGGAKAKGADNLAGVMLEELGAVNLVAQHESLLEDISLEEIIAADPDFIFVSVMGADEDAAIKNLEETISPAWAQLSAVKNGRYIILPKELFHYKPNARWGESYVCLAKMLYPELASEIE